MASLNAQEAAEVAAPEAPTLVAKKSSEFYFDFLGYRYDLHRRVVSRWESLVKANRDMVESEKIVVRYYINASGAVVNIESSSDSTNTVEISNGRKLAEYALALENKSPVPFPESVKKEYPNGFFYQITFVVR